MRMSQEGLNKIVGLLKTVLSGDRITSVMRISNRQYSSIYLDIFLHETENNNHEAIGYDDFAEELWIRLEADANNYPKEADEFMKTWEAWVDLYRFLKKNDKLK